MMNNQRPCFEVKTSQQNHFFNIIANDKEYKLMLKTEYDELRIKEIIEVLKHSYPRIINFQKIKTILKHYQGKSTSGIISYILEDLECFLKIYSTLSVNDILWYKSLQPKMSYAEGREYFLNYLSHIATIQEGDDFSPRPALFSFYQRWVKIDGHKFEIQVIYQVAYSFTIMEELKKNNYFINIEHHRSAASGSLDFKLSKEDSKSLQHLFDLGDSSQINKFLKEKYPTIEGSD